MKNLEQVLQWELGTFASLDLPEPDPDTHWQKLTCCLFCGMKKKNKAYVNYRLGWYKCFKCGRDVSVEGNDVVSRFRPQIDHAAEKCASTFCAWDSKTESWSYLVPRADIWQHACCRILTYAGEPSPRDNDAGKLADWEIMVKGDPNQLDRYVLKALNCDMQDFARKERRRLKRDYLADPSEPSHAVKGACEQSDDDGTGLNDELNALSWNYQPEVLRRFEPGQLDPLESCPTLRMRYEYGFTVAEIAKMTGKTCRTVERMIKAEKDQLTGKTEHNGRRLRPQRKIARRNDHYTRRRNGRSCPPDCKACRVSDDRTLEKYLAHAWEHSELYDVSLEKLKDQDQDDYGLVA
jgi:hypothetical protein